MSKCIRGLGSSVGIVTELRAGRPGDRIPVGARFSTPVQTCPRAHPASCTMGTRSFPGVKSGWGMTLALHPLLVPWSRKSTAIPLLPLWAVRPVQSLSASTRVHFTFTFYYIHTNYFRIVAVNIIFIHSPRKQACKISTVCTRSFRLVQTRTFTLSCPSDCNAS